MPAARHRQPHAEHQRTEAAGLHAGREVLQRSERHPGQLIDRRIHVPALHERAQRPQDLEVAARLHLHEDVGHRRARRAPHVDQHDGAVLLPVGNVHAFRGHRIASEQPRMRFGRIAAPEDHQVGPVADLSQRRGALAHRLEGHAARSMADRRGRVDVAPDHVGDGDRLALRLAGRIRQTVDHRKARVGEDAGGGLDRLLGARLAPLDQCLGTLLDAVLLEPGTPEHARIFRLHDLVRVVVHGQMHVVADAAAERAGRVAYHPCIAAHGDDSFPGQATGSICTSIFFDKGMPLPAVSPSIRALDSGP